jgi:hypothetical protein
MTPDTKRNQAGQDQSDVPRQAIESGEPEIEGRMRGRAADEQADKLEGAEDPVRNSGEEQVWELGRQPQT